MQFAPNKLIKFVRVKYMVSGSLKKQWKFIFSYPHIKNRKENYKLDEEMIKIGPKPHYKIFFF